MNRADRLQVPIEPLTPKQQELFEDTPSYLTPPVQRALDQGADLIDFPCSPTWVAHYAELGITRDYPPEFYQHPQPTEPDEDIAKMQSDINRLKAGSKTMWHKIKSLKDKPATPTKQPSPIKPIPQHGGFDKL